MGLSCLILLFALFTVPIPALASDATESSRRVEASLALPARLSPPDYLTVISVPRPLRSVERCRDPSSLPVGETVTTRALTPIKVEVFAFVVLSTGGSYLLVLDNFSFPDERKGRIQSSPILEALGIR